MMRRLFPFVLVLVMIESLSAQNIGADAVLTTDSSMMADAAWIDSTFLPIAFETPEALIFLEQAVNNSHLWRNDTASLADALKRLLIQSQEPYDSAILMISSIDLREIPVHTGNPILVDSLVVNWINDSTFILNPMGWNSSLFLREEERYIYPVDFSKLTLSDSLLDGNGMLDTSLFIADTMRVQVIDTAALEALEIMLYNYHQGNVSPPIVDNTTGRYGFLSSDLSEVYFYVPGTTWMADEDSPFYILRGEHYLDSLQMAINKLLDFTEKRDSSLLLVNDLHGGKIPLWLTTGRNDSYRFWVKNYNNDSITLWIGNPAKNEISLLLEDEVNFSRLAKEEIYHLPRFVEEPEIRLYDMSLLKPEPIYWDFEMSNLLTISQTYLSNWTKGGESTFSTIVDVTGNATYNNKDAKTQWINIARLKFGTIMTQEKGNRVNHDQFEVDSKYNRNAVFKKIGMSASFYMKNQLAKGYNYPNDSVAVSKFLNPGTLTVGLGAEYKPIDKTTINFAPLSYKTTFVLDTANIDQTKHGIDADKRAKREMGMQVVVNNEFKPFKDFTMTNRVRLFSNYLYKPQNVDVDWEMILEQKISWFFTIRLNLHLIYDDDVRFPLENANGDAILNPDGSKKEVARAQFKEYVGLALSFNL